MTRFRYHQWSFASGCVWGIIAIFVSLFYAIDVPWAGVVTAPFIGLLVGAISRPMHRRSTAARVAFAIGALYLALALFGFCDALWRLNGDSYGGNPFLGLITFPGIVTLSPPLWSLFGLSILNHWWLGLQYMDERRSTITRIALTRH